MLDDWSMSQGWLKKRIYYLLILRRLLKKCSRIHCTAEAEREQAEKWLAGTPVAVIPYVVDVSPFTEAGRTGDESNIPHILFLSRIHPKKSPHLLVEAAAILARRGQEIRLTIAGPVDDRAYAAKMKLCAEAANITSQVAFPGLVTGKEKVAIYGSADLFVLPTQQENFGIVLVEALASGTPVLTTRGTDIWKELQAAGAEIVSDRADDVAEAIARLVGNRERLRELGQQGRTWAQEVFGGDTIARRFSSLYRDVAKACESI
jgi:glycosyltransferase involved in cell wall biosynthesis